MSLSKKLTDLNVDRIKSELPDTYSDAERKRLEAHIKDLVGYKLSSDKINNSDGIRLLELLDQAAALQETSGVEKYFVPGTPYSIDNLPKHKAFFKATCEYRETLMLGGNRCGKTTVGGFVVAVTATGLYPDWWEGVRYDGPVSNWAVGKTGQTTRDTVQNALLGPIGNWGTGLIPADCIVKTTIRQGIAGGVDTIEVRHVPTGKISTIGFKSYDQRPDSFYGTAKNVVWLDEPCPELVYNECLIRTMRLPHNPVEGPVGGRIVHTITPKEGLTQLLAQFLSSCDLLAGAERIKGLEAMMLLAEMEAEKND